MIASRCGGRDRSLFCATQYSTKLYTYSIYSRYMVGSGQASLPAGCID